MQKTKTMLTALAVSVLMMCGAVVAQGAQNRTFVSGTGSDGNAGTDCQQAAPCRTFQIAINQTNAGGQVIALDSTGYSAFAVNKSITIQGVPGQLAFIFVGAGSSGMTVTGANTDIVNLRNIYVDGLNFGTNTGLTFTGAARLVVEDCVFRNLTTGISVAGVNNTTAPARMDLINSSLYGNGTAVVSNGSGANNPSNSCCTTSTSMVRINGGNITFNTTGLSQLNPGASLVNIIMFGPSGPAILNLTGNGTNSACSPACNASPQTYQTNSNFGP